jgi:hypothetical protein
LFTAVVFKSGGLLTSVGCSARFQGLCPAFLVHPRFCAVHVPCVFSTLYVIVGVWALAATVGVLLTVLNGCGGPCPALRSPALAKGLPRSFTAHGPVGVVCKVHHLPGIAPDHASELNFESVEVSGFSEEVPQTAKAFLS